MKKIAFCLSLAAVLAGCISAPSLNAAAIDGEPAESCRWNNGGINLWPIVYSGPNEHAILYPLSRWNSTSGEGWALTAYWANDKCGVFPFYMDNPGFTSIGPVWFRTGGGWGVWPLFGIDGARWSVVYVGSDSWHVLGPFGFSRWQDETDAGCNFLLLGYEESYGDGEWETMFFPLYYYYVDSRKRLAVVPPLLTLLSRNNDSALNLTFPLYCYYRSQEGDGFLWTLLGGGNFGTAPEDSWGAVLNTYWTNESVGSFPFFHFGPDFNYVLPGICWDYSENRKFAAALPLLSWYTCTENSSDFRFLLFFGGGSSKWLEQPDSPYSRIRLERAVCDDEMVQKAMDAMNFRGDATAENSHREFRAFLDKREPRPAHMVSEWSANTLLVDIDSNSDGTLSVSPLFGLLGHWKKTADSTSFSFPLTGLLINYDESSYRETSSETETSLLWGILFKSESKRAASDLKQLKVSLEKLEKYKLALAIAEDGNRKTNEEQYEKQLAETAAKAAELGMTMPQEPTFDELWEMRRNLVDDAGDREQSFRWWLLMGLASGEYSEKSAITKVLWMLYNHKSNDDGSQTTFFPFVTVTQQGDASEVSWLWGGFMSVRREADGDFSGRLCFIKW